MTATKAPQPSSAAIWLTSDGTGGALDVIQVGKATAARAVANRQRREAVGDMRAMADVKKPAGRRAFGCSESVSS